MKTLRRVTKQPADTPPEGELHPEGDPAGGPPEKEPKPEKDPPPKVHHPIYRRMW